MNLHELIITVVAVATLAGFTYLVLYLASNGRINNIFTVDAYTCGMAKLMLSQGRNDMSGLYRSLQDAGSQLHGCGDPLQFVYKGVTYKLVDGKYLAM